MKLTDLTQHGRRQPTVLDAVLLLVQVVFGTACVVVGILAFTRSGGASTAQVVVALCLLVIFVALWVVRSALLSRRPERTPG